MLNEFLGSLVEMYCSLYNRSPTKIYASTETMNALIDEVQICPPLDKYPLPDGTTGKYEGVQIEIDDSVKYGEFLID